MSSPVVTVIVPGRDVAEFAEAAIDSLREQSITNWRAILVDDGSVDDTAAIFARAADSDSRFQLVKHDLSLGLSAARNAGLDLVSTPFLGFLDADDVMTPRALELLTGSLLQSGSDFALGAYVRLRPDADGAYHPGAVQPWVAAATVPPRAHATLAEHPAASGNIVAWSKVSRTDFWTRHGLRFPIGKLYEDQELAQRMYTLARGFDVVSDVVVQWRERADGSSITQHKDALPVLIDYLNALRSGLDVLDRAGATAATRARIRLILDMDVPPLVRIAQVHPDDAYRRILGTFVRELSTRAQRDGIALDESTAGLRQASTDW